MTKMELTTELKRNFIQATPKPELDGELGLTLHEIAQSLGADFKNVKRKFESLKERHGAFGAPIRAANETNDLDVESYVLPVDEAKLLITQYKNAIAIGYCRFLISRDHQLTKAEKNYSKLSHNLQAMIEIELEQNRLAEKQSEIAKTMVTTNKRVTNLETTIDDSPLTTHQQKILLIKIDEVAVHLHGNKMKGAGLVLRDFKAKFHLNKTRQTYKDLSQRQFQAALIYLNSFINNNHTSL